jgi:predicted RNase H-like HicB family nuclease
MTTPTVFESESGATSILINLEWPKTNAYRCHICLIPEEDGEFSALVLNLPGAGSCGPTEAEAIQNVEESIRGLIEVYKDYGDPIPWKDSRAEEIPNGAKTKWILVNV